MHFNLDNLYFSLNSWFFTIYAYFSFLISLPSNNKETTVCHFLLMPDNQGVSYMPSPAVPTRNTRQSMKSNRVYRLLGLLLSPRYLSLLPKLGPPCVAFLIQGFSCASSGFLLPRRLTFISQLMKKVLTQRRETSLAYHFPWVIGKKDIWKDISRSGTEGILTY